MLRFYLSYKINFHRVKRVDSGFQDEKWNGNLGIYCQHEVYLSHVSSVRITMCVSPGEGTVLLITPLPPATQRVLLFATSKLFPGDKLGQTLAIFRQEGFGLWLFRSSPLKKLLFSFRVSLMSRPTTSRQEGKLCCISFRVPVLPMLLF